MCGCVCPVMEEHSVSGSPDGLCWDQLTFCDYRRRQETTLPKNLTSQEITSVWLTPHLCGFLVGTTPWRECTHLSPGGQTGKQGKKGQSGVPWSIVAGARTSSMTHPPGPVGPPDSAILGTKLLILGFNIQMAASGKTVTNWPFTG